MSAVPSPATRPATPAAASRTVVHTVRVEFGDCDPAGIVWFPNFFRWIDAASRNFFTACGVPPWHQLEATTGVLGTPLVDTRSRFVNSASYGDVLDIHVQVSEWRGKSFVMRYHLLRGQGSEGNSNGNDDGATLIMECEEVRIFAARRPPGEGGGAGGSANGNGIRAVPIPEDIRRMCA
ncbi:4-hydroxybenzoyl-CoA thioesterase [Rhodoferax koreense]|uniref:4-hydroxybenzoyl-CoA thioesterase n=1 Tax=Rhodoferax koreensis TaxID=1842727 RepID=A0A1P8JYF6_9BURK|nr:acyl-CoA thioesterase [Rhodoferax koreense]APW38711.1 4-hydroxybenzoyl-CoA thioesterase [Rhodoferax koreense]